MITPMLAASRAMAALLFDVKVETVRVRSESKAEET